MATLHAPVKGQNPAATSKPNSPNAMPAGHVCTDACTHDGAVKAKQAPTAAPLGTTAPHKAG